MPVDGGAGEGEDGVRGEGEGGGYSDNVPYQSPNGMRCIQILPCDEQK